MVQSGEMSLEEFVARQSAWMGKLVQRCSGMRLTISGPPVPAGSKGRLGRKAAQWRERQGFWRQRQSYGQQAEATTTQGFALMRRLFRPFRRFTRERAGIGKRPSVRSRS